MTVNTPIGSVWYNDLWDEEMTVESEGGPMNEYIRVSFGDSGIVEDQYNRTSWDFERVE